jgi:hypothetical protein
VTRDQRISLMLAAVGFLLFAFGGGAGLSVISGPRDATIYYESLNKTPAFNQMVVGLRNGDAAKYLAEKGTDLEVLDVTESPQPDPTLVLPSLYVTAGESVLYKTTITDVKAPVVLEAIKAHGG